MNRFLLSILFVLLTVLYPLTHSPRLITEDDPRWDCETMGNKVCGEKPLGLRLQEIVGAYGEVTFDPETLTYTVSPK